MHLCQLLQAVGRLLREERRVRRQTGPQLCPRSSVVEQLQSRPADIGRFSLVAKLLNQPKPDELGEEDVVKRLEKPKGEQVHDEGKEQL